MMNGRKRGREGGPKGWGVRHRHPFPPAEHFPNRMHVAPRVKIASLQNEDENVVVLTGLQTLMPPVPLCSQDGHVPVEGYFMVVNACEPQKILHEKGFVFRADRALYPGKKNQLDLMKTRIRCVHGLDPQHPIPFFNEEESRGDDEARVFSCMRNVEALGNMLRRIDETVRAAKTCRETVTLFLCLPKHEEEVKAAFAWFQSHFPALENRIAIRKITDFIPTIDVKMPGADDLPDERCPVHPFNYRSRTSSGELVLYDCMKVDCCRMRDALVNIIAEAEAQVNAVVEQCIEEEDEELEEGEESEQPQQLKVMPKFSTFVKTLETGKPDAEHAVPSADPLPHGAEDLPPFEEADVAVPPTLLVADPKPTPSTVAQTLETDKPDAERTGPQAQTAPPSAPSATHNAGGLFDLNISEFENAQWDGETGE